MIEGWTTIALRDCGEWSSGGTPSKEHAEYWNGDIPWISASSMHSVYAGYSDLQITGAGAQNGTRLVPEDTILILVRGSMLYNRVPICITTREVAFNQDVKAIVVNKRINPKFLLYSLLSNEDRLLGMVEPTGIGAGKLSTDLQPVEKVSLPVQRLRSVNAEK